ncbi:hypothetical protein PM082_015183 [Marasmius tenuissimus]|nr:hypothetical protein PM082_015183 [Marasmius tenuissimus]
MPPTFAGFAQPLSSSPELRPLKLEAQLALGFHSPAVSSTYPHINDIFGRNFCSSAVAQPSLPGMTSKP